LGAERFFSAGLREGLPFPPDADPEDFLATVSSYLSSSVPTSSVDPSRPCRDRVGRAIEVALGEIPDTMNKEPTRSTAPATFPTSGIARVPGPVKGWGEE
jgi:hypothetical protein